MKTVQELKAIKAQKLERMAAIEAAAADEGRTMSDPEHEEHKNLGDDVEAINRDIEGHERRERLAGTAKAVEGGSTEKAAGARSTTPVYVKHEKPEPGIRFAQLAMALAKSKGDAGVAYNLMKQHYPNHPAVNVLKMARDRGDEFSTFIGKAAELRTKDAIDGGTTATGSWASALLAHNDYSGDFLEFLRDRTILGQFGQGSVPALRSIPFNVNIKGQTAGGTGYWVGEGQPKPVTKFGFNSAYHGFNKLAAISVISDELIRFSDPSAERLVRDGLADAVIETMDTSFVDATAASSSRPAGILNGVTGTASSGTDHAAVKQDIKTLWATGITAKLPMSGAVYLTTPSIALSLSLMHGDLSDAPLFPNIGLRGGDLLGVPVIVSDYVPDGNIILVFAPEIYLSDDGTVAVDASREASLQMMDDAATNAISDLDGSSPAPVATAMVSMFQTNSVALRAERYINWSKRRAAAVERITGVAWGDEGS